MTQHTLNVWIGDQHIGTLIYFDKLGYFDFIYEQQWIDNPMAYPISPALPFTRSDALSNERYSVSVRRFFENLLPEGQALEDAAKINRISRVNLYGLLSALGKETTGALSLHIDNVLPVTMPESKRQILHEELSERIATRSSQPFNIWDGRVRLSIAGLQDKLPVFIDHKKSLFLVEGKLASTHILKPESQNPKIQHLVANEHFCLTLASQLGIDTPPVDIMRIPEPVLVVKRFDRLYKDNEVKRLHCIDICQVLDLAVSDKYERNFGSGRDVKHIRDGVSLERLFEVAKQTQAEAITRMNLLRWILFQYLIGNSDAHGKNVSCMVEVGGLKLAPFYDMVSTCIYSEVEHEAAMAIGDEFDLQKVRAFDWANFAQSCGIDRRLLLREIKRITGQLIKQLPILLASTQYTDKEKNILKLISAFALKQVKQLEDDASQIIGIKIE